MLQDELISSLFDGQPHPLAASVAAWLASSRRFTEFVTVHHTKIRKKLRTVQDLEALRDLELELQTPYLLLRERALSVRYEPQHPREGRSPDFAVDFTTSLTFMLEVTRLRSARLGSVSVEGVPMTLPLSDGFSDALCSKLGQLLPQRSNVLVVGAEPAEITQEDLRLGMLRLQQRAERNDPAVIERHGFRDRAAFFQHYQRLSLLLIRDLPLEAAKPPVLWENPQAKHPLPARARAAVSRSHTL